jgi:hypothetical protein
VFLVSFLKFLKHHHRTCSVIKYQRYIFKKFEWVCFRTVYFRTNLTEMFAMGVFPGGSNISSLWFRLTIFVKYQRYIFKKIESRIIFVMVMMNFGLIKETTQRCVFVLLFSLISLMCFAKKIKEIVKSNLVIWFSDAGSLFWKCEI